MARDFYNAMYEENPAITAGFSKYAREQKPVIDAQNFKPGAGSLASARNIDRYAPSGTTVNNITKETGAQELRAAAIKKELSDHNVPSSGQQIADANHKGIGERIMNKAQEYGGAVKNWASDNPGKAAAIGAATAAGLGALAFRKKIAEKLKNRNK